MELTQYEIRTGMGKSSHWVDLGLTEEDQQILNDIGYGTNKEYSSREEYLNKKYEGKYLFSIQQTEWDTGDFCEAFRVAKVTIN